MAFFWEGIYKYLVVASAGKLWRENDIGGWTQIATGGVPDNADIEVYKLATINGTLAVGAVTIPVTGLTGPVANGDIFTLQKDIGFEYTVTGHTETGGNTTQVTIAAPGLVVAAAAGDVVHFKRLGAKTNGAAAGGAATITIDGITGALANSDWVVIKGERIIHVITAHTETGGNTTSVTLNPSIQSAYVADNDTVPIIFALGNNKLFWTDGTGPIYSWDGVYTADQSYADPYDLFLGGVGAPKDVNWIVWFQNRLIAAGSTGQDETLWFSDFGNANKWDQNFQQMDVGGGESDPIRVIVPWMDLNLVVFKEHSIYVVNMDPSQNPDPSDPTLLVASYGVKLITHWVGCAAPHTVTSVGGPRGDIFFLGSDLQVRSLRRVVAAENQQELELGISYRIQDQLDRITMDFISNSRAYYFNNRYLLAIPADGQEDPLIILVFDTTHSNWSGIWGGLFATAFCTKFAGEGLQALVIGLSTNMVFQWLGDTGVPENDPDAYKDAGVDIPTAIKTRAYTLGDFFNWKTGLNCELEFRNTLATVNVTVLLDQATEAGLVGSAIDTTTNPPLYLPFVLGPFTSVLPGPSFRRKQLDLQHFGQWRELQLYIRSESNKLVLRSVKVTGFIDTMQIQTLEDTPV
jgi:hypothetical protein